MTKGCQLSLDRSDLQKLSYAFLDNFPAIFLGALGVEGQLVGMAAGIILGMHPANGRPCYNVTSPLIGRAHTHAMAGFVKNCVCILDLARIDYLYKHIKNISYLHAHSKRFFLNDDFKFVSDEMVSDKEINETMIPG